MQWEVGTSIFRIAWALAGSLKTTDLQGGTNAFGTYPLSFKLAATLPISPPPMFALASCSQYCSPTPHACLWARSNPRIEENIIHAVSTDFYTYYKASSSVSLLLYTPPWNLIVCRSISR